MFVVTEKRRHRRQRERKLCASSVAADAFSSNLKAWANRAFSWAAQSRTSPICALQVYDFGENNARASHAKRILKGLEKLWVNPPIGGEGKALFRLALGANRSQIQNLFPNC